MSHLKTIRKLGLQARILPASFWPQEIKKEKKKEEEGGEEEATGKNLTSVSHFYRRPFRASSTPGAFNILTRENSPSRENGDKVQTHHFFKGQGRYLVHKPGFIPQLDPRHRQQHQPPAREARGLEIISPSLQPSLRPPAPPKPPRLHLASQSALPLFSKPRTTNLLDGLANRRRKSCCLPL